MQSAIDIVLRRFAEYHDLEGAFARTAVTERAKGILMERHGIDEQRNPFSRIRLGRNWSSGTRVSCQHSGQVFRGTGASF